MSKKNVTTIDANEAVASVAYRLSEVIAIYPITPSSPMGESADYWYSLNKPNLWGTVPSVFEMQSEGGAAGAVHGALLSGSLATTFTASQGLLLMIPNMYKIAGELTPAVFHVAARSLAAQALSIFGDHADVMAARATGWAMLCSNTVQEAQDLAVIAHATTLECRVPFVHFFDGFRTSHEINKIQTVSNDVLREMVNEDRITEVRARALSPEKPTLRGTAQNPDVYFQGRESANPFYNQCVAATQAMMDKYARLTGRQYKLYEYAGAPDADRVVVLMGSGCETAEVTSEALNKRGQKTGVLKVRLFRPLDCKLLVEALPASVKSIAVLDRTKEPGSAGEPLYQDVVTALVEMGRTNIRVVGGRYGLSSKEFTPAMAKAVFDNLAQAQPKNKFTVGINDDVTFTSLPYDESFGLESSEIFEAVFYGLGSDGTVGANKDTIKIIGENTENYAQAYFVYDSKKAGAITVSHLRFGPTKIRAPYLVYKARFVGCHQPVFLERMNVAELLADGGVMILNSPAPADRVWHTLPLVTQRDIIAKKARLYTIDALSVAREAGMGNRVNTVMQVAFFQVSGVMPAAEAIKAIKDSIKKTYGKKGDDVVAKNIAAVDIAISRIHEVQIPATTDANPPIIQPAIKGDAPLFIKNVLGEIGAGRGDLLPVSAIPADGCYPTATTRFEKRNLAVEVPVWDPETCIQCGKCVFVCPHACIRSKAYEPDALAGAPEAFKSRDARLPGWKGLKYTLQVAVEDCTGCSLCVDVCPAKSKTDPNLRAINMRPQEPIRAEEAKNWDFFTNLPDPKRHLNGVNTVREMQNLTPYFEFSGACAGCGETPYLSLLTRLFGDRLVVANATGCSSIYGGNLPTTPWSIDKNGRGPAWANSLFEDNAEFGLGIRVAMDQQQRLAREMLGKMDASVVPAALSGKILENKQKTEADIYEQRLMVDDLKKALAASGTTEAKRLLDIADTLAKRSVWIVGGDGWAYDIGYGGLDHVLASGANVKVLVLDTEVYSNTGGQCSKSTPRSAIAKFASAGKPNVKKDMGQICMSYGNIYVGVVAFGAKDEQTLKTFLEAEAYDGPAIIIAYSHCIAHGYDLSKGLQHQKSLINSGEWILYRYNPERLAKGENPLQIDSAPTKMPVDEFLKTENRFNMLARSNPELARSLHAEVQKDVEARWERFQQLFTVGEAKAAAAKATHQDKPAQ